MKKIIQIILAVFAVFVCFTASAQNGFNVFEQLRTTQVVASGVQSGGTVGNYTNNPIDTHGFEGICKLDICVITNAGGGTLTALVETSPDLTNWTAITYAQATATNIIYTNSIYAVKATNTYLLPGVITTPTAATAGFASQYLTPAQFTNTAAVNVAAGGTFTLGWNIQDQNRYLRMTFTVGGAATNYSAGAVLTARKQQFP